MTEQKVPSIVLALADQVHMTPIAWRIEPTYVVICFEQGPKIRFDRESLPVKVPEVFVGAQSAKSPVLGGVAPIAHLSRCPSGSKIQKLPVISSPHTCPGVLREGKRSKKK
jgi:hypothetical protein